jgi:hypothetical protein
MRLAGTAGSGQSYVINAICNLLRPDEVLLQHQLEKPLTALGESLCTFFCNL